MLWISYCCLFSSLGGSRCIRFLIFAYLTFLAWVQIWNFPYKDQELLMGKNQPIIDLDKKSEIFWLDSWYIESRCWKSMMVGFNVKLVPQIMSHRKWEAWFKHRSSGFNLKFSPSHCFCYGARWLRHIQDWIVTQLSMGFLGWCQRVSFYWLLFLMQLRLDNESNVEMRRGW